MFRVRDQYRRSQVAIAALFCFLGFQYATWVSRIPALKTQARPVRGGSWACC